MRKTAEIVVIGGGVIGTSIAYYLAKEGRDVVILEKGDLASGSSGACDKAILMQSKKPGIHLELALKSAEIYKTLTDELEYPIEYANDGGMIVIETEEELAVMKQFVKKQREIGLGVELLDGKQARSIQPALADHIIGATHSDQDAQVNPIHATLGFATSAKRLGVEIYQQTEVTGIKVVSGAITAVETTRGQISTRNVVNCTGAYAPFLGRMVGLNIPIRPRRGQIVISEPMPKLIKGDMLSAKYIAAKHNPDIVEKAKDKATQMGIGLSLGQADSGNLLIGASREFVGYDKSTTYEALSAIIQNAIRIIPALKNINMIRNFAGLRPSTMDGLPILGGTELDGYYIAAGHEGDGIALAPITGQFMAELICQGKSSIDLSLFHISRFDGQK